jgi:hypothetical protein
MKITDLKYHKNGNRVRSSASIIWEDCGRTTQELYFETIEEFAEDISCDPHSFLVACTMPAMRFGERRILIDSEICPELMDGLNTAMGLVCNWFDWYNQKTNLVRIEAKSNKYVGANARPSRAGFLFSGGIDSLATLRSNRIHYSSGHPGFIKDGILIYGLEVIKPQSFEHVLNSVSFLAKDAGVTLIPVYTNIRELGPGDDQQFWGDFWIHEFMGATFSAVAHALSRRLSILSINSCHDIPNLIPYGSHPLLNPNYSSGDLKIRHEGIHLSRFEKTKLISDWDLALQRLRVCNRSEYYTNEVLNCGECEKCVRTMLALVATGALKQTTAFPIRTVTSELVDQAVKIASNTFPLYKELILPLNKSGRHDLARAVQLKIDEFHQNHNREKWKKRTITPIVEFDKKYFNGSLKRIKNHFIDGYPLK